MKLATIRVGDTTRAVRADGDLLTDLGAADLGEFLADGDWPAKAAAAINPAGGSRAAGSPAPGSPAAGRRAPNTPPAGNPAAGNPSANTPPANTPAATYSAADADFAPLVPNPSKVLCVGLNYRNHIQEMGRDLPEYPTLFAKFADCLIGAGDDIARPDETGQFDWEVELAVVIGKPVRRATEAEATDAIAGFTVLNDITCRDWQFRTKEWLQGKIWDSSTPVGPYLVTPDELPGGTAPALDVTLTVDGEVMQSDNTGDLLFGPVALVRYISTIIRLNPGDIIATGTPGGVGQARKPPRFLTGGETVVTEIEGIGRLTNRVAKDTA